MLNKNLFRIGISSTLKINQISKNLEKSGKKIYKLGFGQSPFPVPEFLQNTLKKNVDKKDYISIYGLPKLRDSIANFYNEKYKINITSKNILIGPGSKELLFLAQSVCNKKTNIITPAWVSYINQCDLLNVDYKLLNTNYLNRWMPTGNDLLSIEKNDLLILNHPNNPTGLNNDMKKLSENLINKPLVISDEIYSFLNFDNKIPDTFLQHYSDCIVSNGISKWCGAGGWRLGYMIIPDKHSYLKDDIVKIGSEIFSSVNAPVQYACIDLFDNFDKMEIYLQRSNYALKLLSNKINNIFDKSLIKFIKPNGGFYYFLDFNCYRKGFESNGILNSNDLCNKILNDTGVAILSGSNFGRKNDDFCARLAYVDFNGKDIINNDLNDLQILDICNHTIEGCKILVDYINNINIR